MGENRFSHSRYFTYTYTFSPYNFTEYLFRILPLPLNHIYQHQDIFIAIDSSRKDGGRQLFRCMEAGVEQRSSLSIPKSPTCLPERHSSHPATNLSCPATDLSRPATDTLHPTTDISHPAAEISHPATETSRRATNISYPATDISHPTPDRSHPTPDISRPRPSTNSLSTGYEQRGITSDNLITGFEQ